MIFPEITIEKEFSFLSKVLIPNIFKIMDTAPCLINYLATINYIPFYCTN